MKVIEKTDEALEQLIDQLTEQLASDEEVDLEALVREHPQHGQRLRLLLPAMCGMAQLSRQPGADGAPCDRLTGVREGFDENPEIGDYEILGEIGRGGMGVVFRARERTLRRDVALKVLPLAALADRRQLARFHNETRAAAALHHSHIVPIFSVGEERGIHYYAMQYIAGPTLDQVLNELRGRDQQSSESQTELAGPAAREGDAATNRASSTSHESTEKIRKIQASIATRCSSSQSEYTRTVARWGIQVAEALAHAHEHGVVHRDIKPANLLVEDMDNIWITDFGLARLDVGTTITRCGDLLGTLRYMSPEQVGGQGMLVDHRTDVYSLGATLYEALTLRPAFVQQSRGELLHEISTKDPPPPRHIHDAIPVDLETIVLKAMDKDRSERYDTALELADDLRRFVENHPIQARRASLVQRLRKWAKRHVGLVMVGMLALILVSVTASLAAVLVWRANEDTKRALVRQDAALQRATDKTRIARQAADEMYRNITLQGIASDPELTATQRRFLESALSIYEQLSQESSREFSAQLETGHTLAHMGDVLSMSGKWKESLEAAKQAINVLAPLLPSQPDNVEVLRPLGQLYHNYAIRLGCSDRSEQAIAANREAATVVKRLSILESDHLGHQVLLASIELNQSFFLRSLGRLQDAESSGRRAWECASAVSRKFDKFDWDAWSYACRAAGNLASVLQDLGRVEEAEQVCRQAVDECERLLSDRPSDLRLARMLGQLQGILGSKLLKLDKLPEAEAALRAALAATARSLPHGDSPAKLFKTELSTEDSLGLSHDPAAFLSHAQGQVKLGEVLKRNKKYDESVAVLQEATFVLGQLMIRYPDMPNFQLALAQGEWYLARVLRKKDEPGEAEQHFRKAVEHYRGRSDKHPRCLESLSLLFNQLGNLLIDEGRHTEAQEAFEAGIEQAEASLEWRPDQPDVREVLELLRANLARVSDSESQSAAETFSGKP